MYHNYLRSAKIAMTGTINIKDNFISRNSRDTLKISAFEYITLPLNILFPNMPRSSNKN